MSQKVINIRRLSGSSPSGEGRRDQVKQTRATFAARVESSGRNGLRSAERLSRKRSLDFRVGEVVGRGDQTAVEEARRVDFRIDQSQPAIRLLHARPHIPLKVTERLGDRIVEADGGIHQSLTGV